MQYSTVTSAKDSVQHSHSAEVAILLCTYNGSRFLEEQLDSFEKQTHTNWKIYVSDDGSSDQTIQILEKYCSKFGNGRLIIKNGPKKGFSRNFLSLINDRNIKAEYYAFSDQDDIWHEEKLARSLAAINNADQSIPSLYCSRTRLINSSGLPIGFSPIFSRTPSFRNALVQSIAGANTMLINNASRDLLNRVTGDISIVAHDWLTYLVVSGCGGFVFYDPVPTLDYRQHDQNVIGANVGLRSRAAKTVRLFTRQFRNWTSSNLKALACIENQLTHENKLVLRNFSVARQSNFINRIHLMKKTGIFRQSRKGNASLIIAIILKKI